MLQEEEMEDKSVLFNDSVNGQGYIAPVVNKWNTSRPK